MDVFQDGQGQYVLANDGQRIDGWWLLEDDADPAVLVGPDGTVVSDAGELLAARQHATKNRTEIEASALCGCFYCLSLFKPQAINDWLDFDAGELESDATTACLPAMRYGLRPRLGVRNSDHPGLFATDAGPLVSGLST